MEQGNSFSCGKAKFQILAPIEGSLGENVNEEGMVMELKFGKFKGLLPGDIGIDTRKNCCQSFQMWIF